MITNKSRIGIVLLLLTFVFSVQIESQNNKVTIESGTFYGWTNSPHYRKLTFFNRPSEAIQIVDQTGAKRWYYPDKSSPRLFRDTKDPKKFVDYGGRIIVLNEGGGAVTWYREGFTKPNKFFKIIKPGDYFGLLAGRPSTIKQNGISDRHIGWTVSYSTDGNTMYMKPILEPGLFYKPEFRETITARLAMFGYANTKDNRYINPTSYGGITMTIPHQGGPITIRPKTTTTNKTTTSVTNTTTNTSNENLYNKLSATTKTAQIHDAVRASDYNKVEDLVLKKGADPNLKDAINGRTALHYAATSGDNDVASFLIKSGNANINLTDNKGLTALDLAVEKNNLELAKTLLQNGANAGLANDGLNRVINTQNKELLKMFLQNGANATNALNKVIEKDDVEMLNIVFDNSSARATNQYFEKAVNIRSQQTAIEMLIRGLDKEKAMDFVIGKKDKQMVSLILGTNPNITTSNKALVFAVEQRDMTLAQNAIEAHNANPTLGMAPAVKTNNIQMVTFLLSKGANPNDQMDEASSEGKKAIVELLLTQSANPDLGIKEAATNNHVSTLQVLLDASGDANLAMPIAIDKGNVAMVNMCIAAKKPADVYRSEYVVKACEKSNLDILNALLLAGADANPGMPVSIAKKDVKLVRELATAGADVNKPEYIKKSAELKDHATAQVLLEKGADANPGMPTAIELGDFTMVDLLLKNGADASSPNFIATASKQGNVQIIQVLIDKGADANNGVIASIQANKPNALSLLIKSGGDASKDHHLVESIKHNNSSLTKLVIDAGADANLALEPSVNNNAYHIIPLLSQNNVDVTDPKYLAIAVKKNYTPTANALVKSGASAADWWDEAAGENLLHKSIRSYLNWSMVPILVSAGIDVNKKTKSGDSPLHLAVYQGKDNRDAAADVVIALINAKADVNATNASGETVLKAAPGRRKITKPLRDAGAKNRI